MDQIRYKPGRILDELFAQLDANFVGDFRFLSGDGQNFWRENAKTV